MTISGDSNGRFLLPIGPSSVHQLFICKKNIVLPFPSNTVPCIIKLETKYPQKDEIQNTPLPQFIKEELISTNRKLT